MKNRKALLQSHDRGFTVIEIVVAVGVAAAVLMVAASTLLEVQRSAHKLQSTMNHEVDLSLGIRMTVSLIRKGALSYNNLIVPDDEGNNFFDLITDISAMQIPNPASRSRRLTLSLRPSGRTTLFLLFNDDSESESLMYNPIDAYQVGPPPADLNRSGTLSYRGVNFRSAVSSRAPAVWQEGKMIMLYNPIPLREIVGGEVDVFTPPRHTIFLGQVVGDDLRHSSLGGLIRSTHPSNPTLTINSPDVFFRHLASVGGSSPLVILQPIGLLKLTLEATSVGGATTGRLVKQIFTGTGWSTPEVIFPDVKEVVFKRELISTPQISVQIVPRS